MGQKHLQLAQRVQIETLLKEGHNLSFIAKNIGYSRETVTKEIQRTTLHATMDKKSKYTYIKAYVQSHRGTDAS
ncbi:transposase [Fructobacillus tropaeoli]|uniref:Transposase n=1 Tax=Fructobacillus tropaeoli TaxID=709323 RepID=A0A3F3HCG4_9LACO|nr:helix-turn-helix domain-containing protein [Fructobacillus tropaeoli]GAP05058.1 transposase [Fructobacillus tropaeoli]